MGGTNETKINGLRWHVSGNEVHIHDDSSGVKFISNPKTFKKDIEGALKDLERGDGAVSISGDAAYLLLVKNGNDMAMFVYKEGTTEPQLKDFLKGV